jgi:uncharacterized protein YjbI with pentapeptide repeats
VLSPWTIASWAVLTVLVGVGVAVWLLLAYTGGNTETNQVQLDAIRTAGTIVVGTGGVVALLLAARRQRGTEIALKQKDRDQADAARAHALQVRVAEQTSRHQERVAAATEADAESRRITDLYTKAVEQLGARQAPVRLGGLYALERLAQDNPGQRQTIVNVLCAYLRMPYQLPGERPADDADEPKVAVYLERVQEREVRLTAQRLLADHLKYELDRARRNPPTFWPDITLDLTGATLIDFSLPVCRTSSATFTSAVFVGDATFQLAITDHATFRMATFTGDATFDGIRFTFADFESATFHGDATFWSATFTDDAVFRWATFHRDVVFTRATFSGDGDGIDGDGASAAFLGAQFTGSAGFRSASFTTFAEFTRADFAATADFAEATFTEEATFELATFAEGVPGEVARFWTAPPTEDQPAVGQR